MGLGWRTAFCTSIPKGKTLDSPIINETSDTNTNPSPKLSNRFISFFSQPSTPRLNHDSISSIRCRTMATNSAPSSPRLHCKTKNSSRFFNRSSTTPSSPNSPSTFPLFSKTKCGICSESVKTGQGTAIFTAECGHNFHFPCVVKKKCALTCPMCSSSTWKEMHMLDNNHSSKSNHQNHNSKLKVYNDDEPLSSPACGARFNPIFESDESNEEQEFPGFFSCKPDEKVKTTGNLEVVLSSETAVVSVGKTTETYTVVLKIRAPPATLRKIPIDLVVVLNVSRSITLEKMQLMKKTMRLVVSSLSATDRLSIVAYSSTSKRLLPLRRMSPSGKRTARRIIDAVVALDAPVVASIVTDTLKKAVKVIEDRRECNPTASILLFSNGTRNDPVVSSTRFSTTNIQVHSISLNGCVNTEGSEVMSKRVCNLLSVVSQEVRFRLGFKSGSAPGEISAIYSYGGRPELLGSGSDWFRIGDLYSQEERKLMIELKVTSSFVRANTLLSVGYSYRDSSTQQNIYDKELTLLVSCPRAIGTSTREVQRLRCMFVSTRAIAESRRLLERGDVAGAHRMLVSARALVLQSGTGTGTGTGTSMGAELIRALDVELADVDWKGRNQVLERCRRETCEEEKAEPLTPTSAWRAAERLAKVAIMRKSLNRVSDLHGFEDARF